MAHQLPKVLFLAFAFLTLGVPKSESITFGKEVLDGSTRYPTVVSVWYAENSEEDYFPICSGTLIEPRIVLTAAHCVLNEGIYAVGYGSDLLRNAKLQTVSATWKNPAYSARQMVNDIGLLLLEKSIPFVTPTALATSKEIVSIVSNKKVRFEIVGWGNNQNKEPATYLRMAVVDDQSSVMKKYRNWRNDVWLAVGKYNKKEKVYAGSCNGDSGGPLFATANGVTVLAGVTSWGAEDCEYAVPSIYVRLSYYIKKIQTEGIPTLLQNEKVQNRAVPSVIIEPRIIGVPKVGQVLTCDKGQWSSSTTSVKSFWGGSGTYVGKLDPVNNTITVGQNLTSSPLSFTCTVIGENRNGKIERNISVNQAPKPQSTRIPEISGMPTNASNQTSNLTCEPGTFTGASQVSQEWWIGDSYSPATRIGTGNNFSVNQDLFVQSGARYLYCLSIAEGEGGNSSATSKGVLIPAFAKPIANDTLVISGMPKDGYSVNASNVVTCSGGTFSGLVTSSEYSWLLRESSYATTGTILATGPSISLSSEWFKSNNYKNLVCKFTVTGPGGSVFSQASANVYAPILPSIYSVTVNGIPSCFGSTGCDWVGVVATCDATTSLPLNSTIPISYSWRIYDLNAPYYPTNSTQFQFLSNGKSIVFTESILQQAVLRKIGCTASISNSLGSVSGYSTSTYVDYRNISVADTTPPSVSFQSIAPFNGPSFRLRDPFTITWKSSDSSGLGTYPFTFKFVVDGTTEISAQNNGNYSRIEGNDKSGTYEQSFILPSSSIGGKLGSYQIYVRASDSKSNFTGWILLTTIQVSGERTN